MDHTRVLDKLLGNTDLDEKIGKVTEAMGNKNTSPPKGPDTGLTQKEEDVFIDSTTGKIFLTMLCIFNLIYSCSVIFVCFVCVLEGIRIFCSVS